MGFIEVFIGSLALIGLAELGDKTQVVLFSLSAQKKTKLPIVVGAILGFVLVDGIAVIFGKAIASLVPSSYLALFAGVAFIVFGIYFLLGDEEDEKTDEKMHSSLLISSFALITIMELGDKTQILAMTLAARYENAIAVFAGTITALAFLSIVAVIIGTIFSNKIEKGKLSKVSGYLFILLGILELLRNFGPW